MKLFPGWRVVGLLRRIALALEALVDHDRERIGHDRQHWDREDMRLARRQRPRKTEFGTFDIDAANARWRAEQEAAEFGGIPDDKPSSR